MSLVIFKDGNLYADTRAWGGEGGSPTPGAKNKVLYANDGSMIGATSATLGAGVEALNAYNAGEQCVDGGDFYGLVVKPGVPGYFYWVDDKPLAGPFTEPFFAVGSGAKYALGALSAGGTVKDAFKAAAKYDWFSRAEYRTFSLRTPKVPVKRKKR
jgi:hypothetical protein